MKTLEEVLAEFKFRGISARKWAMPNGYEPALVYQVLQKMGYPCRIGKSHEIAVKLGFKEVLISNVETLTEILSSDTLQKRST